MGLHAPLACAYFLSAAEPHGWLVADEMLLCGGFDFSPWDCDSSSEGCVTPFRRNASLPQEDETPLLYQQISSHYA